jgi:secreted PhoX family phosphatase
VSRPQPPTPAELDRRQVLKAAAALGVVSVGGGWLSACTVPNPPPPSTTTTTTLAGAGYGALLAADANGLRLPAGFSSRVIGVSGQVVPGTAFTWHANPDGGACFATGDGGWIYVSNDETALGGGGAGMVRFAADGTIVEARRILSGTERNCAGGATPWGTWLSCEEFSRGLVWECDPTGASAAVSRPGLGAFQHEAVAVDPVHRELYLTEDRTDGGLYRFRPTAYPDLSAGTLEVLTEVGGALGWATVPDPSAAVTSTRYQVAGMKVFNGGEGIIWFDGAVFFTTKGDNRVWRYETATAVLTVVYDRATSANPVLSGVDNITHAGNGDLYVAEDGGNMEIVHVVGTQVEPVVQIAGVIGSEVTGPAFSPDGTRLYFSSQRNPGTTYEVTGPWRHG